MFGRLCLLVAIVTVVHGCIKTSYKRHGEACGCDDRCLDNSYCLRDQQGNLMCQCLPCEGFDPVLQQCITIPGFNETCYGLCAAPYVCTNNTEGREGRSCQPCPTNQLYDEISGTCVDLPTIGEPCGSACSCNLECQPGATENTCGCSADSTGFDSQLGYCTVGCLRNTTTGCRCVPDGNYPACDPLCQDGVYVTCYQDILYVRDCSLGWYLGPNGQRFTAKMVYEPTLDRCERSTPTCPRALDQQVEG